MLKNNKWLTTGISLNAFEIKILAVVCMVADHVGLFFFPQYHILRLIGRAAFPLFAWLIGNGAVFTHDIRRYFGRIVLLAFVSQIPFTLANQFTGNSWWYFNVVFTLSLGLGCIWIFRLTQRKLFRTGAAILACLLAIVFNTDYGAAGVLSIVGFYVFFDSFWAMCLYQSVILGLLTYGSYWLNFHNIINVTGLYPASSDEFFGLFSLLAVFLYNRKPGIRVGYLFYYFYPVQYILIYIFQIFLSS